MLHKQSFLNRIAAAVLLCACVKLLLLVAACLVHHSRETVAAQAKWLIGVLLFLFKGCLQSWVWTRPLKTGSYLGGRFRVLYRDD